MILDNLTFERLYCAYCDRLRNFAARYLNDLAGAEDVVNDSFVRLWNRYGSKDIDKCEALLYSMVRNACLDRLRHLVLVRSVSIDSLPLDPAGERLYNIDMLGSDSADSDTMFEELRSQVAAALGLLPPKCRKVFMLSRLEHLKNREIAERLGISEKAVEKHISRALKHLRSLVEENYDISVELLIVVLWLISIVPSQNLQHILS